MKNHLDNYFYYTKRERNGLLVLLLLVFAFLAAPAVYRKIAPVKNYTFPPIEKAIISPPIAAVPEIPIRTEAAQPIDPNIAAAKDFHALGLSEKTTNTILNYRNKGGKFYKPEDLKKIYGLSAQDYERISPLIFITEKEKTNKIFASRNPPEAITVNNTISNTVHIKLPTERFDPNTISREMLKTFGLPDKVINTMLNFRKSGGKFYKPADLLHVYGMKENWLKQLKDWIDIPAVKKFDLKAHKEANKKPAKKQNPITDINTASYEDWQQLTGIGPYYADKLVTYREKLGGFHSLEQIQETFGIPDSVKQAILPDLRRSPIFRHMNINTISAEELAAHPYIKWKQANLIVNYRTQHGPYESTADLKKILGLKADFLDRISPYLSVDNTEENLKPN